MTSRIVVAWLACVVAGLMAIGYSLLIFIAAFSNEGNGSPERVMFLLQGCTSLAAGAICWGVAAIIEILLESK